MHHFWVSEAKSLEVSRPGYRLKVMLSVSTQSTGNHLFVLQFNHSCHFYGCRHMLASLLSMPPLLFQLQTHTHVHTHTQRQHDCCFLASAEDVPALAQWVHGLHCKRICSFLCGCFLQRSDYHLIFVFQFVAWDGIHMCAVH